MSEFAPTEISINVPLTDALREQLTQAVDSEGRGHALSNGPLSIILPNYQEIYFRGVSDTLRGTIERITLDDPYNLDARPYFGVQEITDIEYGGSEIGGFIAFVPADMLHLFDNPGAAAANFHANIIDSANESLAVQQSAFRLGAIATRTLQ